MILLEKEPKAPKPSIHNPKTDPATLPITGKNVPTQKIQINPYQAKFNNARTMKQKEKVVEEYIKGLPNYNSIKYAQEVIANSIIYSGFDPKTNPFLYFILKFKKARLPASAANLIRALIVDDNIDVTSAVFDWLYRADVYSGVEASILFKIKALTYASNPDLQRGASEKITVNTFLDGRRLRTAQQMKEILDQITISDAEFTIGDYINYCLKQERKLGTDVNKKRILLTVIEYVFRAKGEEAAQSEINRIFRSYKLDMNKVESIIKNLSETDLLTFDRVTIDGVQSPKDFNRSKGKIAIGIVNNLASKAKKDAKDKEQEQEEKAVAKEEEKNKNKGFTLLSAKLGTDGTLKTEQVRDYVAELLPNDNSKNLIIEYLNEGDLDDAIEDVLQQDFVSHIGRDPIVMLDNALRAAVIEEYRKAFK